MTRNEVRLQHEKLFPNQVTLPEICLSIRMALNGAADPWPDLEIRNTYHYLMRVLSAWEMTSRPEDIGMDTCIFSLITSTVNYIYRWSCKEGFSL